MFFTFRTHLIHQPFASNTTSCTIQQCCYVTKLVTITSPHTGQSPVQIVPACPVQIRAHHHIDVYTDINERDTLLRQKQVSSVNIYIQFANTQSAFNVRLLNEPQTRGTYLTSFRTTQNYVGM